MPPQTTMSPESPDPLDDLLAEWRVEASVPSDFRRSVWRRIAADIDDLPWADRLLSWWFQPWRVALSVVSALAIGAFGGLLVADYENTRARASYFSSINPMDQQHQALHHLATR